MEKTNLQENIEIDTPLEREMSKEMTLHVFSCLTACLACARTKTV